jgi:hypothetical protein
MADCFWQGLEFTQYILPGTGNTLVTILTPSPVIRARR